MTATLRQLPRVFDPVYTSQWQNLLVSGCSYTWNNSTTDICTWPYYLRDLGNFEQVWDCSQGGSGPAHCFNSVINELTTNQQLTPNNTIVIVMWSSLQRFDWLCDQQTVQQRLPSGLYDYYHFGKHASLSGWPDWRDDAIQTMLKQYRITVDPAAQVLDNSIRIIALHNFLRQLKFNFVFVNWKDPKPYTNLLPNNPVVEQAQTLIDPVRDLDTWTNHHGSRESDGHPTPDSHLSWTRNCLVPYLTLRQTI